MKPNIWTFKNCKEDVVTYTLPWDLSGEDYLRYMTSYMYTNGFSEESIIDCLRVILEEKTNKTVTLEDE